MEKEREYIIYKDIKTDNKEVTTLIRNIHIST